MTESPAGTKPCKFCAEDIKEAATICRFCNRSQVEAEAPALAPPPPPAPPPAPAPKARKKVERDPSQDLEDAIVNREFSRAVSLLPSSEQAAYREEVDRLRKNNGIAYLFYVLLGAFGAQKFYVGEFQWGALYLSCTVLCTIIFVVGGLGGIAFALLTGGNVATATAPSIFISLGVSIIGSAVVSVGLVLDLFCIPRQVTKANDRIRLDILIDIANRIYPDLRLPPLPSVQAPLVPIAVGLGSALIVGISLCVFLGRLGDALNARARNTPTQEASRSASGPQADSTASKDNQAVASSDDSSRLSNSEVSNYKALITSMLEGELANDESKVSDAQRDLQSGQAPAAGDHSESERINKIGLTALKAKNYAEAATNFQTAAQADPSDAKYLSNLAYAEMHTNDLDNGYEHICSSLSLNPSRDVAWDDLALILAKKGDQNNAVAAFMLANRAAVDKGPKYLQDLQKDEDQNIRNAAATALSKMREAGRISDAEAPASALPTHLNQCTITKISKIGTRLEDTPDSGDAVSYENGGYQVSYDKIPGLEDARVGDTVKMQLIKLPRQADGSPCPDGDNRGSVYRVTDLRTNKTWEAADSQHCCGGA